MWKMLIALPVILLGSAMLPLPYGYYTFLRIVVTIASVWLATIIYNGRWSAWVVTLGLTAIIYNPLVKIHLSRETHSVVNIATIIVLLAVGWRFRKELAQQAP
jgi:hypothetical protein